MSIYVCDSPMGAGKTSAAITYMNQHPEKRFLFVTPYLAEIDRITGACPTLNFQSPSDEFSCKLHDLHALLESAQNIACTHALFGMYTQHTGALLQQGGYTLILDEVFGVMEPQKTKMADIELLFTSGLAEMEDDGMHIRWLDDTYDGSKFLDVKRKSQSRSLIRLGPKSLYWVFPVDIFLVFEDVYILTYLFEAQIQSYYYDISGVQYTRIGTDYADGQYVFSDTQHIPEIMAKLADYIHIIDDKKLNQVGNKKTALSSTWYNNAAKYIEKPLLDTMRNNVYAIFRHRFKGTSNENMWTCFKRGRKYLEKGGYKRGFVPCNARATNEHAHRKYLAYCINVFLDPDILKYFQGYNVQIDQDAYALSEMIQWIWRSAIRNGEPISIYIPSRRMRELLINWIESFNT